MTGNQYHDANGDDNDADASGILTADDENIGPDNGFLPIYGREGITVSFEFEEDKVAIASAPILWNIGLVQWLESDYSVGDVGHIMVTDYDINLNPEELDTIFIDVWSDSDAGELMFS